MTAGPGRHRAARRTRDRWSYSLRSLAAMLFGSVLLFATVVGWRDRMGIWAVALMALMTLLFFGLPLIEFTLRHRPAEIDCPRISVVDGRPAIHFPGDRAGMRVSIVGYVWVAALLGCFAMTSREQPDDIVWVFIVPAAFFLSYSVFGLAGRFIEDGLYLTEHAVLIRARGLRAEIPWSSIAGSRTYKSPLFPYHRVAIDLHPGSPRMVSTTVPWWIGSPRPRRDTVFLTMVQIPGMVPGILDTNPGAWIPVLLHRPPTRQFLESLDAWPELVDAMDYAEPMVTVPPEDRHDHG